MGNDLQTVLLLYSAFPCIFRFFGLTSSDTVTTLVQSLLASFLPSLSVVPAFFHKYADIESATFYSNLIPMIRVTEMYYIIAETTTDDIEALNSINLVLENRGLDKLTSKDEIPATILSEYQKEFWGEGQLFFYYKRINASSIPSAMTGGDVEMNDVKYSMPLPESETNFR